MRRRFGWLLAATLLLAVGVRVLGCFGQGYPYGFYPDETNNVERALKFGAERTLDPGWYNKPALGYYLLFLEYGAYCVGGLATGAFSSVEDFAVSYVNRPGPFFLIGRISTSLMGVLTVLFTYGLGKALHGRMIGLLGALALAVTAGHVTSGQVVKMDVPAAMFTVWSSVFVVGILKRGRTRDYVLAGLLAGLGTATKYYSVGLLLPYLYAHLFREPAARRRSPRTFPSRPLLLGMGAFFAGFFVGSPYNLLNPKAPDTWLWPPLRRLLGNLGLGTAFPPQPVKGNWADAGPWEAFTHLVGTLTSPAGMGGLLALLFGLGLALALRRGGRRDGLLVLVSLSIIALMTLGSRQYAAPRHLVTLYPFAALLAGRALLAVHAGLARDRAAALLARARPFRVLLLVVALPIPGLPLYEIVSHDLSNLEEDPRLGVVRWIEEHVPAGAVVLVDHGRIPLAASERRCDWGLARMDRLSARGRYAEHALDSYRTRWRMRRLAAGRYSGPTYDVVVLEQPWLTESLVARRTAGRTYNPTWPRSPWSWLLPRAIQDCLDAGREVTAATVTEAFRQRLAPENRDAAPVELWTRPTRASRAFLTREEGTGGAPGRHRPVAWLVTSKISYANYRTRHKRRNFPDFAGFYDDLQAHYDCFEFNADDPDPEQVVRVYDLRRRVRSPRVRRLD